MKPDEYDVGGSGDMTDLKKDQPEKKDETSSTDEVTGPSASGVWTCSLPGSEFHKDKPTCSGDVDKAAFPALTSSVTVEQATAGYEEDSSVSVSQNGKKYIITKRNLIVNYLPQNYTDRQLFNLFVSYGPIDSVKIMRDATTGYSYGFGFVNFVTEEDGIRARCEMNGSQVENKRIKVSFARPPSDDIKDTNLYVTNLPRNMTEENLFALFAPFGEIVQKKLLVDRHTNLPRGVAFIRYERRDQAAAAINALNNYVPQGAAEPIRIRLAEDHGKQKAAYLAGFRAGLALPNAPQGGHSKVNNSRGPNSWQYSGKRPMDGWSYDKRNRGPMCNSGMMEGFWTAPETIPPPVHASPYVFPGNGLAAEQAPFCESNNYGPPRKRKRLR